MLKPIINLAVYAANYDPFDGSIGITIPAEKQALDRTCTIEANNVVNLASGYLWESCALATPSIRDVYVEVTVETDIHSFRFMFDILSDDTTYNEWSPALHDSIESAKKNLRSVLEDMMYDLAIDYYGLEAERRGNHAYTIRRRN